jgi:caffeoyl-CoA O-methyltransferase
MNFLPEEIENYALKMSDAECDVLRRLNRETHLKINMPRMLSGHLQGLVLQMLSKMIRPKTILEIGTYTGYSAICLAQGLQKGGMLHTIDINEELQEITTRYIHEAGLQNQIKMYLGNAVNILSDLTLSFDMVFMDADKENYGRYYDLVFPKVNSGGYIIADNVLWSGKILNPPMKMDVDTKAIYDFSATIRNDNRVEKVLLPIRDGLLIVRKK